jgi:hypothetical protein
VESLEDFEMIIKLQPKPSRTARLWIGELPPASFTGYETLQQTVPSKRTSSPGKRVIAVEIRADTGPRTLYGLLGGEIQFAAAEFFGIDVGISTFEGPRLDDTLAIPTRGDEVRVGLPREYAEAACSELVRTSQRTSDLSSGQLSITCAAHSLTGSSQSVFTFLSRTLFTFLIWQDLAEFETKLHECLLKSILSE